MIYVKRVNLTNKLVLYTISNTLFVGKVFYHFANLDSTNRYALNLASKNNPSDGTVISTYNQSEGRGQIGSKWESEPDKNISISIIFYPDFLKIQQQFFLNQAISLALYDFIAKYIDYGVNVKWPNDIYIKDYKISGILMQNILTSSVYKAAIIGIGVNINQSEFISDAPNPTSLNIETGLSFNLDILVNELCICIENRYLQLKSGQLSALKDAYTQHLYQYDVPCLFQRTDTNKIFEGKIAGVLDAGQLIVTTKKGDEYFDLKGIRML